MNDPTCRDESDPNALSVDQARARIFAAVAAVAGQQRLTLRLAHGRILAADVHARLSVPHESNAAMDGYALRHADVAGELRPLQVIGTALAGKPFTGKVGAAQAVRIMTGAVLPEGADTVVMQEETQREGDTVRPLAPPRRGEFVRRPGDDVQRGALLLRAGTRLRAAELGLLATQGIVEVTVHRRPRVAFFSTGDELVPLGSELGNGRIYDSNRYLLYGLLQEIGVEPLDMGAVGDEEAALAAALEQASAAADAVITSGGVSVGEADLVHRALRRHGSVELWKIAMRPGRPLTYGKVGDAHFFGLPGNPVSVAVTFALLVGPALRKLAGSTPGNPLRLSAITVSKLTKAPGRRDFQRGILCERDGRLLVESTGGQGSHVLSSMTRANCYIVLGEASTGVEAGAQVEVIPFATEIPTSAE